jgi:hypothetical protein
MTDRRRIRNTASTIRMRTIPHTDVPLLFGASVMIDLSAEARV